MGRERLTGCARSASRSAMSFIAYTAPAKRQNTAKAEAARDSTNGANISFANTIGARTNTFFTHWWGRTVRATPRKRLTVLTGAVTSGALSTGSGIERAARR